MTVRGAALLLVAAIVACTMKPGSPSPPPPETRPVYVGTKRVVVHAEIARTPRERERGLGGRARLLEDHGMLFVYDADEPHQFWMKDCFIGLDIAFVESNGRVANVATLGPGIGFDDEHVPRANSARPTKYVLETQDGWFARHGLGAGDVVDVSEALSR